MAPKRAAPSAVEAVKKALRASYQAVKALGDETLTEEEVNTTWEALEKVAQAAPARSTDDSATAPLDPMGMAAELRDMRALSRHLMGLLGKSLPHLSDASDAGGAAVAKEVRAVYEHYTLRAVWEGLLGLKQACGDASAAIEEREGAFGAASGEAEREAARQAWLAETEKQEAAEAKYEAAVQALEAAQLHVQACLDGGAFPRELPASYDVGGEGSLPPDAKDNAQEVAYDEELARARADAADAAGAADAADAAADADADATAAAAAAAAADAAAAAAAAAAAEEEAEEKKKQEKQLLEENFKGVLGALPRGRLVSYAIKSKEQEEELNKTLKAAGTAAKALMAAPHGCSEAALSELAGGATVEQLKAYPAAGGQAFNWAAFAAL